MSRLSRKRLGWLVLLVLVALTLVYELFRRAGAPGTVALLIPLVVLTGFVSGSEKRPWNGLQKGLLAGAWVGAYSIYLAGWSVGPVNLVERYFLVPASMLAIALLVGFLRAWAWRGLALERAAGDLALDQNMARLETLENLARELNYSYDRMTDAERKERIKILWKRTTDIGTLAQGWRQVGSYQYWARQD